MADLSQHTNYTGLYSGLLDNFWVTVAIGGLCIIGHEIEVHIPRRHGAQGTYRRVPVRVVHAARRAWGRWRSRRRKGEVEDGGIQKTGEGSRTPREVLGSRESWEFGYIFQPKAWRLKPAPPVPRWPFAWVISSLRVKERDMPESCGLDVTLHMRFLRGSFFYVLLQAFTVLPILMPVHVHYAPPEAKKSSMTRAGISSLVESSGAHWLWIHATLIWWVTITWTLTLLWITWGGLAYRRREIRKLARTIEAAKKNRPSGTLMVTAPTADGSERTAVPAREEPEGVRRFRTLMVENIPPDMRNEEVLREYFDHYLERHRLRSGEITHTATWVKNQVEEKQGKIMRHVHFRPTDMFKTKQVPAEKVVDALQVPPAMTRGDTGDTNSTFDVIDQESADGMMETEVEEVILVRKLGAVASLRARRTAVLRQLEVAHVKMAQRVLAAVASYQKKNGYPTETYTPLRPVHDMDAGLDALNGPRDEHLPGLSKDERLNRLTAALGNYVGDAPEQCGEGENTVWDVLHALPRGLLNPYQDLTHLKVTSFFRNQNAPLIDYLTTKLNYLSHRLDQAREKPLSSYGASSTAFVVFKDARTARLALKLLATHPTRTLACRASPAPDWTNLLWPRLAMSIYRTEFVRKWVIQLGVWVFTLLWIFPVSLLCALSSFTNIAGFFKPLRDFLSAHPKLAPAISSLAPVILVAGLTIAICPILLVVANKAETINTRLAVHNSVLERFWKFLMVNGVVFFAIGQSAIEAYLTAFQTADFDPLPVVASAFPTAAPYFASYILLQVAIQPCFEIFRFGLPTIVYVFGTRVSVIPRQRRARTEYPTFSHFSQVPQQLLQGAIMHLFMLLNPLVIPITLVYYGMCYVVWKRQFTYVYGRLYENNGRRTSVRVLRYSLDALALAQFVLFAFFILSKAKGHAISTGFLFFITLGEKLIITRALVRRHDDLDVEEADIICPPAPESNGAEMMEIISPSSDAPHPKEKLAEQSMPEGLLGRIRHAVIVWWDKWIFAVSHRVEPGYRRPIPFDRLIFSFLDRHIAFKDEPQELKPLVRSETDNELLHEPDHAIQHPLARTLVTRHHPFRPWEDIPPYPRSRGYSDQPAYTDDYDDFLWLPRDPLSTLDLDDTVEMRLSLTTSTGGSGKIGDWPPDKEGPEEDDYEILDAEGDQSYGGDFGPSSTFGRLSSSEEAALISPGAASEDRLIVPVDLPEEMGSEARSGAADLVRRGTRRMGERLTSILRRPRAMTNHTDHSGLISMRTLSLASRPSHDDLREHHRIVSTDSTTDNVFRRPSLLAFRPLKSTSLPVAAVRSPPRRRTTGESAHSESSLLTVPHEMSTPTRPSLQLSPTGHMIPDAPLTESVGELGQIRIPPGPATAPHATFDSPAGTKTGSPSVRILGRSASGRRPSRLLSPETTPARGVSEGAHPVTAPTLGRSGSSSLHTPSRDLLRVRSTKRDRSESVSAAQQALIAEVIQEERIAAESSTHKEHADKEKEQGEVMKEQAKLRRVSKMVQKGLTLGRSASKREMSSLSSTGGLGRPDFARRTSSARRMPDGTIRDEGGGRRLSAGPSGPHIESVEPDPKADEMGRTMEPPAQREEDN